MELKRVRNPKDRGVKLARTDSNIVVTKSGWRVISFRGSDGEWYEQAVKDGKVKWYRLEV